MRERIRLSFFERVIHRKPQKTPLMMELDDCFAYFDNHSPRFNKHERISIIHGTKIEIRRVEEGKGYAIEINGGVKVVGVDSISEQERIEIIRRIQNITFPYADHVKARVK